MSENCTEAVPSDSSSLPSALSHTLLWIDDRPASTESLAFADLVKQQAPFVDIVLLPSLCDLRGRFEAHAVQPAQLQQLDQPRVMPNRYCKAGGFERAGQGVREWLKGCTPWQPVPVLIYCGKATGVAQLHQPNSRVYVTSDSRQALCYAAMEQQALQELSRCSRGTPRRRSASKFSAKLASYLGISE